LKNLISGNSLYQNVSTPNKFIGIPVPLIRIRMLYHQSKLGQEQLFLRMSLGPAPLRFTQFLNGPRDIPRKTCSCPRFDWWHITLLIPRVKYIGGPNKEPMTQHLEIFYQDKTYKWSVKLYVYLFIYLIILCILPHNGYICNIHINLNHHICIRLYSQT
jgi:hypothetical protein